MNSSFRDDFNNSILLLLASKPISWMLTKKPDHRYETRFFFAIGYLIYCLVMVLLTGCEVVEPPPAAVALFEIDALFISLAVMV